MKKLNVILSYILVAMVASMITMATFGGAPAEEYDKLDALGDLIEEVFIGEADRAAMEDAAAAAMVKSLDDQWSYYMTAQEYKLYTEQMQNAYVGIGITITVTEDESGFEIIKVDAGGPAEEAGMQVGDVIVGVEGQAAARMSTAEVRDLIRGEENTRVAISIRRGAEVLDLSVTRRTVQMLVVKSRLLEENIGLVTIYNFDERCAEETIDAIVDLQEQGATSLIFDVRNNPGGYKKQLVQVLDYLLPEGPLFRSEDYTGKIYVDQSNAKHLDMPMAVLVNGNSYSAAEFFAAALDEYDAAIVVGEKTTGKGYFQSAYELEDGSAVNISIGKYTTPNGVTLAGVGIMPEIIVEVDEETAYKIYAELLEPADDPQIQAAVKALLDK